MKNIDSEDYPSPVIPVHKAIARIFELAIPLDSGVEIHPAEDWEGIEGVQPNGSPILIGRPTLREEDLSRQEGKQLVFQVRIFYPLVITEEVQKVTDEYERTYVADEHGNVRLTTEDGNTIEVGPGELSDLSNSILLASYQV